MRVGNSVLRAANSYSHDAKRAATALCFSLLPANHSRNGTLSAINLMRRKKRINLTARLISQCLAHCTFFLCSFIHGTMLALYFKYPSPRNSSLGIRAMLLEHYLIVIGFTGFVSVMLTTMRPLKRLDPFWV